jgi:hypothetical protein
MLLLMTAQPQQINQELLHSKRILLQINLIVQFRDSPVEPIAFCNLKAFLRRHLEYRYIKKLDQEYMYSLLVK